MICLVSLFVTAALATQDVKRNVPYAEAPLDHQILDIYAPKAAKNLPVVFWIHGGGWQSGDKSEVKEKPRAFVERGFVFVSTNYRLHPKVEMLTLFQDVSKSLGWVYRNIAAYGGDPNRIFVMGHSAGAQLAALMCIDERYLKAEGVPFSAIRGCVPIDGDSYDLPAIIETVDTRLRLYGEAPPRTMHRIWFGNDPEKFRDYSSVNHVAKGKGIPPFLILYVAEHPDTSAQARRLARALWEADVPTTLFGAQDTTHQRLNDNLGVPDDPSWKTLESFVTAILNRESSSGTPHGIFAAFGSDGICTSIDGVNWGPVTMPPMPPKWPYHWFFGTGAFGNSLMLTAGAMGLYSSVDGSRWTAEADFTPAGDLKNPGSTKMIFANGKFLLPFQGASYVSEDGLRWTKGGKYGAFQHIGALAYGNGRYVMLGDKWIFPPGGKQYGTPVRAVSEDGITWHDYVEGADLIPADRTVAFGNGIFVAGGPKGVRSTSVDGVTWTKPVTDGAGNPPHPLGDLHFILFTGGRFVAVAERGLCSSTDGVTWQDLGNPPNAPKGDIAYGDGRYVGVRYPKVVTSTDLQTWIVTTAPRTEHVLFGQIGK